MIALAVLAPLALMAWFAVAPAACRPRGLLPLASLPALAVALLPAGSLELPELLLGSRLAADDIGRALLLLIGLAWSAAAWYAADSVGERFRSFAVFWLTALSGLVTATLASDIATFYTGYVAMTLASYGLVVHEGDPTARHAGRVYLVLALGGEALLLSGLLLIGARLGNAELAMLPTALTGADAKLAGALLLSGFAVKIGVVPLHVWLPLAHPVAPVPASAILSGVLVKAGLLGALRTVPGEAFGGADAMNLLLALGLFTAFYGVVIGLAQVRLKTVLAYSTVSQMGLLFIALALALAPGAVRSGPLLAVLLLHHGLNKASLFLAAGSAPGASNWRLALLALPALSLAGLPFTTGALAKSTLKEALYHSAAAGWVVPWLTLSSFATALLMLRVFSLARDAPPTSGPAPAVHPAWWLLVVLGATVPWLQGHWLGVAKVGSLGDAWGGLWPAAVALGLSLAWQRLGPPVRQPLIPEGDLAVPAAAALRVAGRSGRRLASSLATLAARAGASRSRGSSAVADLARLIPRVESAMAALPAAGVVLLIVAGLVWLALI